MAWITYTREARRGTLTGDGARGGVADLRLVTFDRTSRVRRAGLGVAAWWSAALAAVFAPLGSQVLLPAGLVAVGIYSGVRRLTQTSVLLSVSGACPDCETDQQFRVRGAWAATMAVTCSHCHRRLRLTA